MGDQLLEGSSMLFSRGLTVERMTMILFSRSNQNGAPREIAIAVRAQPSTASKKAGAVWGKPMG